MLKLYVVLLAVTFCCAQDAVFSVLDVNITSTKGGNAPQMTQLLDGNILFFGGVLNTKVLEYNPTTGNISARASLPHNVSDPCVVTATNGKVYVISGMTAYPSIASVSSEVLIYDPVKDVWINGRNMSTIGRVRSSCGYDTVLQNIHLLGGANPVDVGIVANPHIIYSITSDTWRNASNPSADHGRLGRAYYEPVTKSMVFVGGAFTTAQSAYNTETGEWTQWAPVPDVTYYNGLVVRPDRVMLIAGADRNTLFTYYFANDTWTNGTSSVTFNLNANTALVGGSIYIFSATDFKLYVSRCLVADACDGSDPCLGSSCVEETGFCLPLSNITCDDANVCTTDDTCQVGVCLGTLLSNITCDDNDPCTLEDTCSNGVCTAGNKTAVECLPVSAPLSVPMSGSPIVNAPLSNVPSTVPKTQIRTSHGSVLGKSMQLMLILCTISFAF